MKEVSRRLIRAVQALSATERVILALDAMKAGSSQNASWFTNMPEDQIEEFNSLARLVNAANEGLGTMAMLITPQMDLIEAQYRWLLFLRLWQLQSEEAWKFIAFRTKTPITKSEYEKQLVQRSSEFLPLAEAADLLVERFLDSQPNEIEAGLGVKDSAWHRRRRLEEQKLLRLVESGVITATRKGRRVLVQVGSFYDWLKEPIPLVRDSVETFETLEVFPDEQESIVRQRLAERDRLLKALAPDEDEEAVEPEMPPITLGAQAELLEWQIRDGLQQCWLRVRLTELLWDEISDELRSEDPALPLLRRCVEVARLKIQDLAKSPFLGRVPFELPEPSEAALEFLRSLVLRDV